MPFQVPHRVMFSDPVINFHLIIHMAGGSSVNEVARRIESYLENCSADETESVRGVVSACRMVLPNAIVRHDDYLYTGSCSLPLAIANDLFDNLAAYLTKAGGYVEVVVGNERRAIER